MRACQPGGEIRVRETRRLVRRGGLARTRQEQHEGARAQRLGLLQQQRIGLGHRQRQRHIRRRARDAHDRHVAQEHARDVLSSGDLTGKVSKHVDVVAGTRRGACASQGIDGQYRGDAIRG